MTNSISRREFLALTAAGTVSLVGSSFWTKAWATAETPELAVYNAKVYTADQSVPRAEAFAVRNGKLVAVGKSAEIRGLVAKGTQTFDAKGMMIVPGFNDSHNHIVGTDVLYSVHVGKSFRGGICVNRQHHRQASRQSPADARGYLGRGDILRRHQSNRQTTAQSPRSRQGFYRPSDRGS